MDDLFVRLAAISAFDVAFLLQHALNTIRQQIALGRTNEAERRLAWWETALLADLAEARRQIADLRVASTYEEARQVFTQEQQFRANALRYLQEAINEGSEQRFDRWLWSGRAYSDAVLRFLAERQQAATLRGLNNTLDAGVASMLTNQFPVLHAHLEFRRDRASDVARQVVNRLHNAARGSAVGEELKQWDAARQKRLATRDELLENVRNQIGAAAIEPIQALLTLEQQIRALERAVRFQEQEAVVVRVEAETAALEQALIVAFGCNVVGSKSK